MTTRRRPLLDTITTAGLAGISALWWQLLKVTASDAHDALDSGLWVWSWLFLLLMVGLATALRPRPLLWTAAATVPLMIRLALDHTVLDHEPPAPDFWALGEFVLGVEGVLALGLGFAVVLLRRRVAGARPSR